MVFYILISIVFIAELIITFALLAYLTKLDKKIIDINLFMNEAKPKIKEICTLCYKVSEQLPEIASCIKERVKLYFTDIITSQVKNWLYISALLLIKNKLEQNK